MPPKKIKVEPIVEKTEEKPKHTYKKGEIYADMKITDIRDDLERSIYFIYLKRDVNGTALRDAQDKLIWDKEKQSMTPEDFANEIKIRLMTGKILG